MAGRRVARAGSHLAAQLQAGPLASTRLRRHLQAADDPRAHREPGQHGCPGHCSSARRARAQMRSQPTVPIRVRAASSVPAVCSPYRSGVITSQPAGAAGRPRQPLPAAARTPVRGMEHHYLHHQAIVLPWRPLVPQPCSISRQPAHGSEVDTYMLAAGQLPSLNVMETPGFQVPCRLCPSPRALLGLLTAGAWRPDPPGRF